LKLKKHTSFFSSSANNMSNKSVIELAQLLTGALDENFKVSKLKYEKFQ
jgi:hypothetical protein